MFLELISFSLWNALKAKRTNNHLKNPYIQCIKHYVCKTAAEILSLNVWAIAHPMHIEPISFGLIKRLGCSFESYSSCLFVYR